MTVGEWLHEREPVPPPRLAARIDDAVAARLAEPAGHAADVFLETCEGLLRDVSARPSPGREAALDLLAADALATYALEAAAETPARLDEYGRDAMRRIAAIAAE